MLRIQNYNLLIWLVRKELRQHNIQENILSKVLILINLY